MRKFHWVKAALYAIAAGTHELFSKFSSHPHSHAIVRQFIHESLFTVAAAASGEILVLGQFSVSG